ncbi:MAG: hypothetical protein IJ133_07380 [Clostridia bacterium]|nr:hypothetical protein [Clostridia bacterium]
MNTRKFLSALLTVVLLLTLAVPAFAANTAGDKVVRNDKVDQITYTFANSDRVTNYYFDKNKKGQVAYISNDKTELYEIVYGDNGAITAIKDFRNQSYNAYNQYDFNESGKQTAKWHKSEGYGTKNENTRLNGGISKYAASFDDSGRLVRWADDVGDGKIVTTTFTYNQDGTVKSVHEESNDGSYVMDYTYEYMTI